jgi:predicted transcriptional regulator
VRLPVELLRRLDALCALTERTRTYWVTQALTEVIPSELTETQIIADEFAAIQARPDEGLPNERMDEWVNDPGLKRLGLCSRWPLDRPTAAAQWAG